MPRIWKRPRRNEDEMPKVLDLWMSHHFLVPNEIDVHVEGLPSLLLPRGLFNISFSDLCQDRPKPKGLENLFRKERERFKPTEKIKHKRLAINRLISEVKQNGNAFEQQVQAIKDRIDDYMSEDNPLDQYFAAHVTSPEEYFRQVRAWRVLQSERRLFPKERGQLCSLFTLQRLMTDYLLELANENLQSVDAHRKLVELFQNCWILVEQPSSSECIAATKYDKSDKDYLAKIKTRLICLFDPDRIENCIELSDIKVNLYRNDADVDPQESLAWKKQILVNKEQMKRTFYYAALTEKKPLRLTKPRDKTRLLGENQLCHLTFSTNITTLHASITESIEIKTRSFGLCSRANYLPECLSKVFISDIVHLFPDVTLESHQELLVQSISKVFRRLSGVNAHENTTEFIRHQLEAAYHNFIETESASDRNGPALVFTFEIYEDVISRLFAQMRFLNLYPFLAMMYRERLFYGFYDQSDENNLNGNVPFPQLLLRFDELDKQQSTVNPAIIFVIRDGSAGQIRRACLDGKGFVNDVCRCLCEAGEIKDQSVWISTGSGRVTFEALTRYHDDQLKQPDEIWTKDGEIFYALDFLLRETIQIHRAGRSSSVDHLLEPVSQPAPPPVTTCDRYPPEPPRPDLGHAFTITGDVNGASVHQAIEFLQTQFAEWCRINHFSGSLSPIAAGLTSNRPIELPTTSETSADALNVAWIELTQP